VKGFGSRVEPHPAESSITPGPRAVDGIPGVLKLVRDRLQRRCCARGVSSHHSPPRTHPRSASRRTMEFAGHAVSSKLPNRPVSAYSHFRFVFYTRVSSPPQGTSAQLAVNTMPDPEPDHAARARVYDELAASAHHGVDPAAVADCAARYEMPTEENRCSAPWLRALPYLYPNAVRLLCTKVSVGARGAAHLLNTESSTMNVNQ